MKKNIYILAVLAIVVGIAFLPLKAQAYTLVPGGPGIAGFYGWEDFNFVGTGGTIDANVFFAVFAPGDTNNPYPALYTYAYLVQNTVSSTTAISQFTVGVLPGFIGSIANVGSASMADIWDTGGVGDLAPAGAPSPPFYQTDNGGVVPSSAVTGPASVIYTFGGPGYLPAGGYSLTLLYTSPYQPTIVTGSLQDGGSSQYNSVPGPAPEPTSMLLLGMGILGLFGLRRKT